MPYELRLDSRLKKPVHYIVDSKSFRIVGQAWTEEDARKIISALNRQEAEEDLLATMPSGYQMIFRPVEAAEGGDSRVVQTGPRKFNVERSDPLPVDFPYGGKLC